MSIYDEKKRKSNHNDCDLDFGGHTDLYKSHSLCDNRTSMRIWHANDVKSVNIDYFDQRIISLVSRIPISVGELTADALKAISAPVSDWYVMKRIEALLKKGVLQVVIPNKIFYNTIVQLNEE